MLMKADSAMMESVKDPNRSMSLSERRVALAKELNERREEEVLDLHDTPTKRHYVDTMFSVVMVNMAIVCWILGGIYMSRPCEKPLATFLIILGCLAPFAACLPILIRQWCYLHLRLNNLVTIGLIIASLLYFVWLVIGQQWAFASSSATCDTELSTAANVVVFILYVVGLLYGAKVIWYIALRVRYSYKELCLSCIRDPYPNVLQMNEDDFLNLESSVSTYQEDSNDKSRSKTKAVLQELRYHQHELRQSLNRLFQPTPSSTKLKNKNLFGNKKIADATTTTKIHVASKSYPSVE